MTPSAQEWAAARYEHASRLRKEGLTFREIGERLGVGKDRAWQMAVIFDRQRGPAFGKPSNVWDEC
jgi:hypothetical protein